MSKRNDKKLGYNESTKKISTEDKILLIIEVSCYLLSISTLIVLFYFANKGTIQNIMIIFFVVIAFILCGREARVSRDAYIVQRKSFSNTISKD